MEHATREHGGSDAAVVAFPEIVAEIDRAFAAGAVDQVAELIEHDFLAAWFYLPPSRFAEIVAGLLRSPELENPFIRGLGAMLFAEEMGEPSPPPLAEIQQAADRRTVPPDQITLIGRMFGLRLRGRPVEALAVADELARFHTLTPIIDPSRGWAAFLAAQNGVTAMLAGEFPRALASFTEVRLQSPHPSLGFLARAACAQSAMIEAFFGDERSAAALLDEIDRTPRTRSWVEAGVDVARTITLASMPDVGAAEAMRMLDAVPPSALGEVWPFYIVAVLRRAVEHGALAESKRRLRIFERLALPRVTGQGFSGSVFPIANALFAIASGDLGAAREHLESADPLSPDGALTFALLELSASRPKEALRLTARLRRRVRGLRFLETVRYAVNAAAYLDLGDLSACDGVLEMALDRPDGVRPREVGFFPPEVRARAERRLAAWPRDAVPSAVGVALWASRSVRFTPREIDIIRSLGTGLSREQIARTHHVSVNTVKSHLHGIYRKLGVTSQHAAVLEAERRGLL